MAVVTSAVVVAVLGYVLGSIPVAVIVCRRHGVDPRSAGDGNPGYWNAKDLLGSRAALPVFVGDVVKGAAAAGAGAVVGHLAGRPPGDVLVLTWVGAAAGMLGHAWPLFAAFRGGRSILTFAGAMAVLSPRATALAVAALLVVWVVRRSFAQAARVGVFGVALTSLLVDGPWRAAAVGVLQSLIGLRFLQALIAGRRRRARRAGGAER